MTLIERGESFYQEMMPRVVADLERKGLSLNLEKHSRFPSQLQIRALHTPVEYMHFSCI